MKVQILSDVHTEFFSCAELTRWFPTLVPNDPDVLVIAGDLGQVVNSNLAWFLDHACSLWNDVVVVMGNHEAYGSTLEYTTKYFEDLGANYSNLHWLENGSVTLGQQRFLGTTLWFPPRPHNITTWRYMNDGRAIGNPLRDFERLGARALRWLHNTVQENDIVITHHMPSRRLVAPWYAGNAANGFYVHEGAERLMGIPKIWIYGHTHHTGTVTKLGNTTLINNPFGYYQSYQNYDFKPHLSLTVHAPTRS